MKTNFHIFLITSLLLFSSIGNAQTGKEDLSNDLSNIPINNIEQAERYFKKMGCSQIQLDRGNSQRAKEYNALNISREIESVWRTEEFNKKLANFTNVLTRDYGFYLNQLFKLSGQNEQCLEKLLETVINMQERLQKEEIGHILSIVIGRNKTITRGGLIQKSYDLNRKDLALQFYAQIKSLLKKAEDNSIPLPTVRGHLLDLINFYKIEESKEYLLNLKNKDDKESFNYFKREAEYGYKYAMNKLSEHYQEGKGCEVDLEKSKYWAKKAKEK